MSTITLDPPEDHLYARQMPELVERWLATKVAKAKSTQVAYRDKLKMFLVWWEEKGPSVDWKLTRLLLQEYEFHLSGVIAKKSGKPLTYSTRKAAIRNLRIMFKWASTTERTLRNYGEWVPWPEGETPQRKAATVEQLGSLMLAAADSPTPLRDQTIIAFFIGTGCRLGEVAGLKVEDLQIMADGSGTALVTGKRTKANPSGQRNIAFDIATGNYLIRYMDAARIISGGLWLSRKKTFLLRKSSIYSVVKKAVKRAGLVGLICGCHDLRRAFATILTLMYPDSPGWSDLIRRQLGHKHYSQTSTYVLIDANDIRERIVTPLVINRQKNQE